MGGGTGIFLKIIKKRRAVVYSYLCLCYYLLLLFHSHCSMIQKCDIVTFWAINQQSNIAQEYYRVASRLSQEGGGGYKPGYGPVLQEWEHIFETGNKKYL